MPGLLLHHGPDCPQRDRVLGKRADLDAHDRDRACNGADAHIHKDVGGAVRRSGHKDQEEGERQGSDRVQQEACTQLRSAASKPSRACLLPLSKDLPSGPPVMVMMQPASAAPQHASQATTAACSCSGAHERHGHLLLSRGGRPGPTPGWLAMAQSCRTECTGRSGGACNTMVRDPVTHSTQPSIPNMLRRSCSMLWASTALHTPGSVSGERPGSRV